MKTAVVLYLRSPPGAPEAFVDTSAGAACCRGTLTGSSFGFTAAASCSKSLSAAIRASAVRSSRASCKTLSSTS